MFAICNASAAPITNGLLEAHVFESTSPLASDRRVFTPRVVPIDIGSEGLASFAAENRCDGQPVSASPPAPIWYTVTSVRKP